MEILIMSIECLRKNQLVILNTTWAVNMKLGSPNLAIELANCNTINLGDGSWGLDN